VSETRRRARPGRDETKSDAARYKRAADEALRQVDFCIAYLRRIQKRQLAARLAKNRDSIKRRLMREGTGSSTGRRRPT
jgi:hypothetical protein